MFTGASLFTGESIECNIIEPLRDREGDMIVPARCGDLHSQRQTRGGIDPERDAHSRPTRETPREREDVVIADERPLERSDICDDWTNHDVKVGRGAREHADEPVPVTKLTISICSTECSTLPITLRDVQRLVEVLRELAIDHDRPQPGKHITSAMHRRKRGNRRTPRPVTLEHRDTKPSRFDHRWIAERCGYAARIDTVGACDRSQRRDEVAHATRHWTNHCSPIVVRTDPREMTGGGHEPERWFDASSTTPRGGEPDAAS